ncbi:MAG: hypothetical protein ACE14T_10215 [Syntrophales bacterium]
MRFRIQHLILALCFFSAIWTAPAAADNFNLGISIGNEGLQGFQLSVGDYYGVPQREVVVVRERLVDQDELPVVFFIARHAHVKPMAVVQMRQRGSSWMDISLHYGLHPRIFYYSVPGQSYAGPYGHAYGHFKGDRKHWKNARLNDHDIVNLVNLRYMSEHYRCPPERIMQMRAQGKRFVEIHNEVSAGNGKGVRHEEKVSRIDEGRGHGKEERGNKHGKRRD